MWEYTVLRLAAEAGMFDVGGNFDAQALSRRMNGLGQQGWELVTAFDTNTIKGATRDLVLLFKRPIPMASPLPEQHG
ncbi:MAG: DUF4177 domain-containing protein [Planctomycetes bacterium]|nr:DUF4177 domain-containing protein [Planctomycetota bacterium]